MPQTDQQELVVRLKAENERLKRQLAQHRAQKELSSSTRILAEIHNLQSKFIADAPANVVFDSLLTSLLEVSDSEMDSLANCCEPSRERHS